MLLLLLARCVRACWGERGVCDLAWCWGIPRDAGLRYPSVAPVSRRACSPTDLAQRVRAMARSESDPGGRPGALMVGRGQARGVLRSIRIGTRLSPADARREAAIWLVVASLSFSLWIFSLQSVCCAREEGGYREPVHRGVLGAPGCFAQEGGREGRMAIFLGRVRHNARRRSSSSTAAHSGREKAGHHSHMVPSPPQPNSSTKQSKQLHKHTHTYTGTRSTRLALSAVDPSYQLSRITIVMRWQWLGCRRLSSSQQSVAWARGPRGSRSNREGSFGSDFVLLHTICGAAWFSPPFLPSVPCSASAARRIHNRELVGVEHCYVRRGYGELLRITVSI